jgi:3-deoxy-manno-octulosonate cytidylyltransferase (CMP-KDO synthetase)
MGKRAFHGRKVIAVIPARFASSRFPGKPLALIRGVSMIERVYRRTAQARVFSEVLVATDDRRIADHVESFGGKAVMTSPRLPSGTDRVHAALRGRKYGWALNVQGDEPMVPPALLRQLVRKIAAVRVPSIITAAHPISREQARDPNNVKVAVTSKGRALYFSRASIPDTGRAGKEAHPERALLKHIGLYLFHREALEKFVKQKPSHLEKLEKLEQLRAYEAGIPIEVVLTEYRSVNVDVPADVSRVEALLKARRGKKAAAGRCCAYPE